MKRGIRMFLGLACASGVGACAKGFGSSGHGSELTSDGPDGGAETSDAPVGGNGNDQSSGGDAAGTSEGGSGTSSGTGVGGDDQGGMAGDTGSRGGTSAGADAGGTGDPGGVSGSGGRGTNGGAPNGGTSGEAGMATSGGGAGGVPVGGAGAGGEGGTTSGAGNGGGGTVERDCGARFSAGQLLFYTTLDDQESVTNPAVGSGAGATLNPTEAFHDGACGKAMLFGEASHYVRLPQRTNDVSQVSFSKGTIDFWVLRDFEFGDGQARVFFTADASFNDKTAFVRIHKYNGAKGNYLAFSVTDGEATAEVLVTPQRANESMKKNVWVRVTATWDFSIEAGLQQVRLFVDGIEPLFAGSSLVRDVLLGFPTAETDAPMFIGNLGDTSGLALSALVDDFQIYGAAFVP